MSHRAERFARIALIPALVALLAFAGCGGGGSVVGSPVVPPPAGSGTIAGVVVDASNTSTVLPSAVVRVSSTGATQTTGSDGKFTFSSLPAGTPIVTVDPGPGAAFLSSRVSVPVANGQITSLVVTMVPLGLGDPTSIVVLPSSASTDPGGQQSFSAIIFSGSTRLIIQPSWIVQGGIGTIDATGLFTATHQGSGKVLGIAGGVSGEATVTVTAPQFPVIASHYVDPSELPPSGGTALMTIHALDGDGMALAQVQIVKPDGTNQVFTMYRTAGTAKDGTWLFPDPPYTPAFTFPANTNLPDPSGNQAPQDYDVRFIVRDTTGATTISTYYQVRVRGVEAPPPPPPPPLPPPPP